MREAVAKEGTEISEGGAEENELDEEEEADTDVIPKHNLSESRKLAGNHLHRVNSSSPHDLQAGEP